MEQQPTSESAVRRMRWGKIGLILGTVMLVLLSISFAIAPHFQLAQKVSVLGGRATWRDWFLGLDSISFPNGGASDDWIAAQEWHRVASLQQLSFKRCGIKANGLKSLLKLPRLRSLDLEGNPHLSPADIAEFKVHKHLKHLYVDSSMLDRQNSIEHLSSLTELTELSFFGRKIDEDKLKELKLKMPKTRIEVLDPTATGMSFRGVRLEAIPRVLFHPDGRRLITGDGLGRVQMRDSDGQTVLWQVQAHSDWVFGLATNSSGELLATAGGDDLIHIWNISNQQHIATLKGHDDDVHTIAFTPDDQWLLSSSDDMTVRQWDMTSLKPSSAAHQSLSHSQVVMSEHDDTIPGLAVNASGSLVASGSRDGTVRVWKRDAPSSSNRFVHSIHKRPSDPVARLNPDLKRGDVMSVVFHPTRPLLAFIGYDGAIHVWDLDSQTSSQHWQAHDGWAFTVAYSPEGHLLASGGRAGEVKIWNEQGHPVSRFKADDDVASLSFSPQGDRLAASTANGTVSVWSVESLAK